MAQLFGCIGDEDDGRTRQCLGALGRLQHRTSQQEAELWVGPHVGLGCLSSRERGGLGEVNLADATSVVCALDGEIYRLSDQARLRLDGAVDVNSLHLARLYASLGPDFIEHLDGSFSLALYDGARQHFLLANDHFSTRALFWTVENGRLLFASELKGLLAVPGISGRLDGVALAQAAAFSRIFGERTLLAGVYRLRPGTCLVYDVHSGRLDRRRYWEPEALIERRSPLTAERLAALVQAFRDAVLVRVRPSGRVGVSLSGGLDSRAIVAVLARDRVPASTCTTGMEGCADQRLAARIARVADARHAFYALRREHMERYAEALRTAVFVRDGMALVGGFPGNLTQAFCRDHQVHTLLRGHGGENARLGEAWPFHLTPDVMQMTSRTELIPLLRERLRVVPPSVDIDRLFQDPALGATGEAAEAGLAAALSDSSSLSPAEMLSLLYLEQNDGAEVPVTRNGLRGIAEMALPYLDHRFLDLVLSTAVHERCGSDIHRAIIRELAPSLTRIANSNTGAPLDASRARLFVTDKVNSLFKRLQLPGFRHYHYMELWLRDVMAEEVRALILEPRTLERGLFAKDYLQNLLERSRGDASMSRLLNFVVNFEVWCRLFLDGEAQPV